jgi:hypothetical protein
LTILALNDCVDQKDIHSHQGLDGQPILQFLAQLERMVNISMPGYIKKKLQDYNHIASKCAQMCPYMPAPKRFGSEAQAPLPPDLSPKLDKAGIKKAQKLVGSILYYARAIDMTVLMALSTIAVEQTIATKRTLERCTQLLDYLAHNADAKV